MEIKVECGCGLRYKFEVEPVDGHMPFAVLCPHCGLDGTAAANAFIESQTPFVGRVPEQSVVAALRKNRLFCSVSDKHIHRLAHDANQHYYPPGHTIIREGDEGHSMFLLFSGSARVVGGGRGTKHFIARLKAGDCFGEMSLLTGERRNATVRTETDCAAVEILHETLKRVFKEDKQLLHTLSILLAQRQMDSNRRSGAKETARADSPITDDFKRKLGAFFRT